jgi:hypothetical protein
MGRDYGRRHVQKKGKAPKSPETIYVFPMQLPSRSPAFGKRLKFCILMSINEKTIWEKETKNQNEVRSPTNPMGYVARGKSGRKPRWRKKSALKAKAEAPRYLSQNGSASPAKPKNQPILTE